MKAVIRRSLPSFLGAHVTGSSHQIRFWSHLKFLTCEQIRSTRAIDVEQRMNQHSKMEEVLGVKGAATVISRAQTFAGFPSPVAQSR